MENIDWDQVPDDELEETALERIVALKGMFPESMRRSGIAALDFSWYLARGSFGLARQTLWVVATSALIMIAPFVVTKELIDAESSQIRHQQQILLGGGSGINKKLGMKL